MKREIIIGVCAFIVGVMAGFTIGTDHCMKQGLELLRESGFSEEIIRQIMSRI